MPIDAVVTRGFGPDASIALVVTAGYVAGVAPPPPDPTPYPPPPVLTNFQSDTQLPMTPLIRTEPIPIPPNDQPILEMGADGKPTGRLDPAWRLYFVDRDAFAVQEIDQEYPLARFGEAANAEDAAIGAMGSSLPAMRGDIEDLIESAYRPSRPDPEADIAPVQRSWSTFTLIQDTAANLAGYPAAAYPTALYIETNTFILRRSDGSAWTEIVLPALTKLFGLTSSFPALKRSGTIIQVRLADDSAYSALEVLDEAYGSGWDGKVEVPTKNAVYDEFVIILAQIAAQAVLIAALVQKLQTIALTGQAADIGATSFTGVVAPGTYRVSYSLEDTASDLTAGAVTLSVAFTSTAGAVTLSSTPQVLTGAGVTPGVFVIQLTSGAIQYSVAHTGIFGTAQYALYMTLERLS